MKYKTAFNYFMILSYIAIGLYLIFSHLNIDDGNRNSFIIFGVISILYGFYRFGKTINQNKQKNDNE